MENRTRLALVVLASVFLAPILMAQARPRGIYAVVSVEDELKALLMANPMATQAELDTGFIALYSSMVKNPAIAGLAVQAHWDTLNPNAPGGSADPYFWNYVADAFTAAEAWNQQYPAETPKTIQLIVTPGFQSPPWLVNPIPSCDGLFYLPVAAVEDTCGRATFTGYAEHGDSTELPMPWNQVYRSAWQTFLEALATKYGSNRLLVSIAVAGPTAASAEMIVPNNANSNNPQDQFKPLGPPILPSDMWLDLLSFHYGDREAYLNTDQAFIDAWEDAIDLYGKLFSGITLVVTTGNGFPNFKGGSYAQPPAFKKACTYDPNMDCAAETTILEYFMQSGKGGVNAKASQTSGMAASHTLMTANLGVPGVKLLSQMTAKLSSPSEQVLGGAQFGSPFSTATLSEGCESVFPPRPDNPPAGCNANTLASCLKTDTNSCIAVSCIPAVCLAPGVTLQSIEAEGIKNYGSLVKKYPNDLISREQAEFNVMSDFFSATEAGSSFNGEEGTAPMNYMEIYSEDVAYAANHANSTPVPVMDGDGTIEVTAQELLDQARAKLFAIGEPRPSIDGVAPVVPTPPGTIYPGAAISISGESLAMVPVEGPLKAPTALAGTSVSIDGKAADLSYVSPTKIYTWIPRNASIGQVPLVVTTEFGTATTTVTVKPERN